MSGFTFEKDLEHQTNAVLAVSSALFGAEKRQLSKHTTRIWANPELQINKQQYQANIKEVQSFNQIHGAEYCDFSNIIDISMETGTGKTYTYVKTMYELNKTYDVHKFIVVVPTLSIKAGTVNFLKSDALKEHFRDDYQREIKTHVVESKKSAKKHKSGAIDQGVFNFIDASHINKKHIHVLVINAGMLNSKSLTEEYDIAGGWIGAHKNTAINALKAVKPIIIIDEPHKFPTNKNKKTWENIEKLKAHYIIRYGATFNDDYKNLVYRLTAVDAFNDDLVKGVTTHVETLIGADKTIVKLKKTDGKQAIFELNKNNHKTDFSLIKGESLATMHANLYDLTIEKMNKTTVVLSNGLELKTGDVINPYSYSETVQDKMMQQAIARHFKLERQLLTQSPRIKPLTLFFIDDIKGYRDGNNITGTLKTKFEKWVLATAKQYLKDEQNSFYRNYLEKTIQDVSLVHGGYFSRDNSAKDDKIEQEVIEILHDKESLLALNNPRRFIFSKWTLKEGWDNPNIFQICKLRSSGSTTSKIQEVGRGLRLPVNEYMARVKNQQFYLHYAVDSSEQNFADSLINEVNESSFPDVSPEELTKELESKILDKYEDETSFDLMVNLVNQKIIDKNKNFASNSSYSELKALYPLAFPAGIKANKIKQAGKDKKQTPMRVGKYQELRQLWELINQKAVIEYKINNEQEFLALFKQYLCKAATDFKQTAVETQTKQLYMYNNTAISKNLYDTNNAITKISTINYQKFFKRLAKTAFIKLTTSHKALISLKNK